MQTLIDSLTRILEGARTQPDHPYTQGYIQAIEHAITLVRDHQHYLEVRALIQNATRALEPNPYAGSPFREVA